MTRTTSHRLFVSGLSWETDEGGLRSAFERFGHLLEVSVARDASSGRPRGFGFVTFGSEPSAANAIAGMRQAVIDGSTVEVTAAAPDED